MTDTPRAGLGHNGGPTLEPGASWRRHAWGRARADLLPTLPIEVVRLRVARARELGLPYRTYAGIGAATGHDLIGFLFSTNALGLIRDERLPADRQARLGALVRTERRALVQGRLSVAAVGALAEVDAASPAPAPLAGWSELRAALRNALDRRPADRFLVVGETAWERDWSDALRAAGYMSGAAYFGDAPA